jgi:hypothetical protein
LQQSEKLAAAAAAAADKGQGNEQAWDCWQAGETKELGEQISSEGVQVWWVGLFSCNVDGGG